MRKGDRPGGRIATPIRELAGSKTDYSVIFVCEDDKAAERTRMAALAVRRRDKLEDIHTSRYNERLMVYKGSASWDTIGSIVELDK